VTGEKILERGTGMGAVDLVMAGDGLDSRATIGGGGGKLMG